MEFILCVLFVGTIITLGYTLLSGIEGSLNKSEFFLGICLAVLTGLAAYTVNNYIDDYRYYQSSYQTAMNKYDTARDKLNAEYARNTKLFSENVGLVAEVNKANAAVKRLEEQNAVQYAQCKAEVAKSNANLQEAQGKLQRIQALVGGTK